MNIWHNAVLKFLLFFLHLLSVLFHCVELAVLFFIYMLNGSVHFWGCMSAVLDFFFFQFVLPFLPFTFVQVDA